MAGLIAGILVIGASLLGSLAGLVFRTISWKQNDSMLGFAAGVMLAAAFLGLLPSGFSQPGLSGLLTGIAGVFAGAFLFSLLDRFVPHLHFDHGAFRHSEAKGGENRVLLLLLAIAIHNIPEGLATGIAFSEGLTRKAFLVTLSMMAQKIPEGLIVVIPLLSLGTPKRKAMAFASVVAFLMLPGLLFGLWVGELPGLLTAFFYSFTFGAILYVISDEIIPESHEHGFQRAATFSLLSGIILVVLIEILLQ